MLGGGDCFGNVGKMCKPCPSGEQNDCQTLKAACDAVSGALAIPRAGRRSTHPGHCLPQSFCNPICTKLTWECTVTGSGAFTMLSDKPYQNVGMRAARPGHTAAAAPRHSALMTAVRGPDSGYLWPDYWLWVLGDDEVLQKG